MIVQLIAVAATVLTGLVLTYAIDRSQRPPKPVPKPLTVKEELRLQSDKLVAFVRRNPGCLGEAIHTAFPKRRPDVNSETYGVALSTRLQSLVRAGRLRRTGIKSGTRYFIDRG